MEFMYVEFYDHTENCPPCKVRVVGELVSEDELHWKLYGWRHIEVDDVDNECYYSILKSTATKVVPLHPSIEVSPRVTSLNEG